MNDKLQISSAEFWKASCSSERSWRERADSLAFECASSENDRKENKLSCTFELYIRIVGAWSEKFSEMTIRLAISVIDSMITNQKAVLTLRFVEKL